MEDELINKCIAYMILHLNDDVSVKDIADYFHYSEYYFCREFKERTGKSVYSFIKTLKMDQSAVDIKLNKDKAITDIGLDHHLISPSEFRQTVSKKEFPNPQHESVDLIH